MLSNSSFRRQRTGRDLEGETHITPSWLSSSVAGTSAPSHLPPSCVYLGCVGALPKRQTITPDVLSALCESETLTVVPPR